MSYVCLAADGAPGSLYASATDGKVMSRYAFRQADIACEKLPPTPILLHAISVRAILTAIGRRPVGNVRLYHRRPFVRCPQLIQINRLSVTPPNYASVIPKLGTHDGFSYVGMSTGMLGRVSAVFEAAAIRGKKRWQYSLGLTFEFHEGQLDPIVVRSPEVPELTVIAMPTRVGAADRRRKTAAA
jgi:hypothetical protein